LVHSYQKLLESFLLAFLFDCHLQQSVLEVTLDAFLQGSVGEIPEFLGLKLLFELGVHLSCLNFSIEMGRLSHFQMIECLLFLQQFKSLLELFVAMLLDSDMVGA
jgi:hypothetical protein